MRYLAAPLSMALCLFACGRPPSPGAAPGISVGAKDLVYVSAPVVADSAAARLAGLGWGDRFAAEWRREVAYQFNRKGVAVTEDSAKATAFVSLRIDEYQASDEGKHSRYAGAAELRRGEGRRKVEIRSGGEGARIPEREDPTVDVIRAMSEAAVSGALKDPSRKPPDKFEYQPQVWFIF
jgi:hypothetical protein